MKLNAELSGYTMCFPVPGMYAQIQSNMASTLNIDWLLDVGRDVLASQGVERSRGDLLKGLDERIMKAEPARAIYHPYISQAGERGPVMEPAARAMFTGLELGMGFPGPDAQRLRRPVLRLARLLFGDGRHPARGARHRRCGALERRCA